MESVPLTEEQNSLIAICGLFLSAFFLATLLPQRLQQHSYVRLVLAKVYFSIIGAILMFTWPMQDLKNLMAWPLIFVAVASTIEAGFWGHAVSGLVVRLVKRYPRGSRCSAIACYSALGVASLVIAFLVGAVLSVEALDWVEVSTDFSQTGKVSFVRYFIGTSTIAFLMAAFGAVVWVPWVARRTR